MNQTAATAARRYREQAVINLTRITGIMPLMERPPIPAVLENGQGLSTTLPVFWCCRIRRWAVAASVKV